MSTDRVDVQEIPLYNMDLEAAPPAAVVAFKCVRVLGVFVFVCLVFVFFVLSRCGVGAVVLSRQQRPIVDRALYIARTCVCSGCR